MPEGQPNAEMSAELARLNKENKRLHDLLDHGGNLPPEIFEARKQGAEDLKALLADGGPDAEYELTADMSLSDAKVLNEAWTFAKDFNKSGMQFLVPAFFMNTNGAKAKREAIRIAFNSIPNETMKPINERAKAIFDAWSRSVTPYDKPAISRGDYTIPKPGRIEYHPPKHRFGLHRRAAIWAASKIARLRAWWNGPRRARMLATMYDNPRSAARREKDKKCP